MLLRFKFANFRSFREDQEFSMVASAFADHPEVLLHPEGLDEGVLPVAAIYGANASGKTNVLRALHFMTNAVENSHKTWPADGGVPAERFMADEVSRKSPSRFVVDFIVDGRRHQYGFEVSSEAVLEEWLYVYPNGKKQKWFRRVPHSPMSFGAKMPGENRTIENLTRKNSLFLSAAAQNNHEALLPVYKWFAKSLSFVRGERELWRRWTAEICARAECKQALAGLLAAADLGITDVKIVEEKMTEQHRKIFEALASILEPAGRQPEIPETQSKVRLLHRIGDKSVPFEFDEESDGTRAYFDLLGPVISALAEGRVICIDELDASLHPLLALEIVRLFNSPSVNPRGAQLIFNTHDTNLLNSDLLRRDQVWFTEKDANAGTHIYPLSDYKPRRDENLQSGYLQGRYGAIPFISPDRFMQAFASSNGKA
jgi:uncharacterized protein